MSALVTSALGYYVPGVVLLSLLLSTVTLVIGAYGVVRYALRAVRG